MSARPIWPRSVPSGLPDRHSWPENSLSCRFSPRSKRFGVVFSRRPLHWWLGGPVPELGKGQMGNMSSRGEADREFRRTGRRNFCIHLDEQGLKATHLLRDRDSKFTEKFDASRALSDRIGKGQSHRGQSRSVPQRARSMDGPRHVHPYRSALAKLPTAGQTPTCCDSTRTARGQQRPLLHRG